MSQTVYKFPLRMEPEQDVRMPMGATILHVADQFGVLCLWAWCEPDLIVARRRIFIVGTGHPAPSPSAANHIGSVVTDGGNYVWHVFEAVHD